MIQLTLVGCYQGLWVGCTVTQEPEKVVVKVARQAHYSGEVEPCELQDETVFARSEDTICETLVKHRFTQNVNWRTSMLSAAATSSWTTGESQALARQERPL